MSAKPVVSSILLQRKQTVQWFRSICPTTSTVVCTQAFGMIPTEKHSSIKNETVKDIPKVIVLAQEVAEIVATYHTSESLWKLAEASTN